MATSEYKVGLVGARGYVGGELVGLIENHSGLSLSFASSRALAGKNVSDHFDGFKGSLKFESLSPEEVASRDVDIIVLALPNGLSDPFVEAIERETPEKTIIDLSGDQRFKDDWVYGLPELNRINLLSANRVSNPGCYATGMQLGLAPILEFIKGTPHCFGVSGYSGAGTTPSRKNDTEALKDNLMPYALSGHLHEKEVSHHLSHPVYFLPHVGEFFRGISLTISVDLKTPMTREAVIGKYQSRFGEEPLIGLMDDIPEVKDIQNEHGVFIGGFTLSDDNTHVVINVVIDNLLKGAATQALQNINLVLGFDEFEGIFT